MKGCKLKKENSALLNVKGDNKYALNETPIHAAVLNDKPDAVKLLLKLGTNINLGDAQNNTPLHAAVYLNKPNIVELLIDKGDIAILKYGFSIRKLDVNEHIITETLTNAVDRVKKEIDKKADPLAALVVGVDDPWEVSLIKMMVELAGRSAPIHAQQLNLDPHGVIHEIEQAFKAAAENRNLITRLSTLLEKHDMFTEYQDRFFDLVRTNQ